MNRCGTCYYWTTSSTYSNMNKVHRRLCARIGRFTTPDGYCSHYKQTVDKVYCPVKREIVTKDVCISIPFDQCRTCQYRDLMINNVGKGILKRNKRDAFELKIKTGGSGDMIDGRVLLKEAIDKLNNSGLVQEKIDSKNILAMPVRELRDVINKFFDLVESIPANKEDLIPEQVVTVYNKLVDGEIVFLNDEIDGKKVIASNGVFYFKRSI